MMPPMSFFDRLLCGRPSKRPALPGSKASRTLLLGGAGEDADRFVRCGRRLVIADLRTVPGVTLLADLSRGLPFRDGAFDEIVSLEFIEHVSHRELASTLAECARVLAPGGRWLSGCPDMETLIAWFGLRCDCVRHWKADPGCPRCGGKARITPKRWLRNVCGNQEVFRGDRFLDTHKNVLWFDALAEELAAAGFRDVRRIDAAAYYEEGMAASRLMVEAARS